MSSFKPHYDVVIAGARCAGAATALLLARAGARVLLVDRQARGSDTMSTHVLMRTGVLQLERWALLTRLQSEGTPPIGITTFHYGPEAVPVAIRPEHGVHHLYAPRRTVLDRILVEAAEAAGAEVHHGVLLSQLQFDPSGRVVGARLREGSGSEATIAADLVIGADGRDSTVAKLVAAESYLAGRAASALVYGYFEGLPDDGLHWYFAQGAAAGVIPTNQGQHCVFVGLPREQFGAAFRGDVERGFLGLLEKCGPELKAAVEGRGALGSFARVCGCPWLHAPAIRARMGSRRRCRLLQGPSHGARHDRCAARRRAAGARHSCRRLSRNGEVPARARHSLDPALQGD